MNPRAGYLVSQYPSVGHSFILREIRELRAAGFDIGVVSVKPADRPAGELTAAEQQEWKRTRVIRSTPLLRRGAIHAAAWLTRPLSCLRGLGCAVRLAGWDLHRLAAHLRYFGEAVVAGWWLHREGYQRLHSHFTSTVALLAARIFPFRFSMTLHGPDEFTDPAGFALAQKAAAADLVVVISEFGRSQVMRFCDFRDWGKIEVAPLGVDTSLYTPLERREAGAGFEILSVGRLAAVKGCFILLDAAETLLRAGRSFRLQFAGDGPLRAALAAEIEKRSLGGHVTLRGSLDSNAVLGLYRAADVFALASFAEGVPVVLMEAMALRIPCVATRVNGIPELIRDGIDGLLTTPSSGEEMAQALARLMDDADLRHRLGVQGRARVLEKYDLRANVAILAAIFRRYDASL